MNDILPPVRPPRPSQPEQPNEPGYGGQPQPVSRPTAPYADAPEPESTQAAAPEQNPEPPRAPSRPWWRRRLVLAGAALLALLIIAGVAAMTWYQTQLSALAPDSKDRQRIEILTGATPEQIASELETQNVIRSASAFSIYLSLSGQKDRLQAGTFLLSPSQSVPTIVEHLTAGKTEEFSVTFFPGGMLRDPSDTATEKKTDVQTQLAKVGFSDQDIEAAFAASYESNGLFAGRPEGAGLEGYVYGDTYNFPISADARVVLQRSLDELASVVKQHDLEALYKKQGLTLFEGITLASIIQREVYGEKDEKIVAQIFLKRLDIGMPLGADATFEYAATQTGQVASPALDSPYNTRKVKGLPPGPISSPGLSALLAVAHPADTDYLYFVSGDDDINYFSTTLEEHEANTRKHCRVKCGLD